MEKTLARIHAFDTFMRERLALLESRIKEGGDLRLAYKFTSEELEDAHFRFAATFATELATPPPGTGKD